MEKYKMIQKIIIPIFLVLIIFAIEEGFTSTASEAVTVDVDASQSSGAITDVFRAGMMGSWDDYYAPLSSEIRSLNKKPFLRLHLVTGWDNSLTKPADFDTTFQNWLINTIDPNIKRYQNAGYQTVISLTQIPKWLSNYNQNDDCMLVGDGCWMKWQYSAPNDYVEWEHLLQLLVTTQRADGINVDYIIGDEPNWQFYGTEDQYFELYKHSVEAIKGVDSSIKVGALGVGCFQCIKDANCPDDLNGALPDGECPDLGHSMIRGQIDYVSANHIPMDFIDWHFPDLSMLSQRVADLKSYLISKGLSDTLPMSIGEWVYSSQNEDESTEKAAAYAIYETASLLNNGIYRHTATSIYDQSTWESGDWAHVGFFTLEGVIKPKWNAFKALDRLPSQRLAVTGNGFLGSTVAAMDDTKIAVIMSNPTGVESQVALKIKNLATGIYTLRKYLIDGDLTNIHSNSCRYNRKTETPSSGTECGVNGAIDQAVVIAENGASNAATSYTVSAGISQQFADALLVCFNDPTCNIVEYVKTYCQNNPGQCSGKKAAILQIPQLYINLFYHGIYRTNSGKVYTLSSYIDHINNLPEVSLEGSKQESQVDVNPPYSENITMPPYSVILIELLK